MPSSAATGRESEKFNLRLPEGMRDRIAKVAAANGRSMNAEIVHRLEESLMASAVSGLSREDIERALAILRKMVEDMHA